MWAAESSLEANLSVSNEGYFVLSWDSLGTAQSDTVYFLQQADEPNFQSPVQREIPATGAATISGLADGHYYFRAGRNGQWSEVVQVQVRHHSLGRAFSFFGLGLALFLILIGTIAWGSRRTRSKDPQEARHGV